MSEDEHVRIYHLPALPMHWHRLDGPAFLDKQNGQTEWWVDGGDRATSKAHYIQLCKEFDPTLTDEHFMAVFLKYPFKELL